MKTWASTDLQLKLLLILLLSLLSVIIARSISSCQCGSNNLRVSVMSTFCMGPISRVAVIWHAPVQLPPVNVQHVRAASAVSIACGNDACLPMSYGGLQVLELSLIAVWVHRSRNKTQLFSTHVIIFSRTYDGSRGKYFFF